MGHAACMEIIRDAEEMLFMDGKKLKLMGVLMDECSVARVSRGSGAFHFSFTDASVFLLTG
jgi:hypothetical protein